MTSQRRGRSRFGAELWALGLLLACFCGCAALMREAREAKRCIKEKEYARAVVLYQAALQRRPENKTLLARLAEAKALARDDCYERSKTTAAGAKDLPALRRALKEVERALGYAPQDPQCLAHKQAVEVRMASLESNIASLLRRADAYRAEQSWRDAVSCVDQALTLDPDDTGLRGRKQEAQQAAATYFLGRAAPLAGEKRWKEALAEVASAASFEQSERVRAARRRYIDAAQETHVKRAEALAASREWEACLAAVDEALTYEDNADIRRLKQTFVDHRDALALLGQARADIARDDYLAAIGKLEQARKLYRELPEINEALLNAYATQWGREEAEGRLYEAIDLLQRAQALDYGPPDRRAGIERSLARLKSRLTQHYEAAAQDSEKQSLFGRALLYTELIAELDPRSAAAEKTRLSNTIKVGSVQRLAIPAFRNLAVQGSGSERGRLLAERLRARLAECGTVARHIKVLDSDLAELAAQQYRLRQAQGERRAAAASASPADYLLAATVKEFSIRKPEPERVLRTVRYKTGQHLENNPTYAQWRAFEDRRQQQVEQANAQRCGLMVLARLCEKNPYGSSELPAQVWVEDYATHSYYEEIHCITGHIEISWSLIDLRTGAEVAKGTETCHIDDKDSYVEGFAPGSIAHDPLRIRLPSDVEKELIVDVNGKVLRGVEASLGDLAALLYARAAELERCQARDEAVEALVQSYVLRPGESTYARACTEIRNDLRVQRLLADDTTAPPRPADASASSSPLVSSRHTGPGPDGPRAALETILAAVQKGDTERARSEIRQFLKRYPTSPLLDEVLDLDRKMAAN